jgi:hypothetical protein
MRLAITCASRLLPLIGTGRLSAKKISTLPLLSQEKGTLDGGEEKQSSDAIIKQDSANVA